MWFGGWVHLRWGKPGAPLPTPSDPRARGHVGEEGNVLCSAFSSSLCLFALPSPIVSSLPLSQALPFCGP